MAKLEGVTHTDSGAIVYEGDLYRKTDEIPVPGDIVYDRNDYFVVVRAKSEEREENAYDDVSIMCVFGEAYVRKSFVTYRKSMETVDILASKRTQLATLTAEISQLEAQLAEESRLKVGDYARVNDGAEGGRFVAGDIVMVCEVARAESAIYPLGVEAPLGGCAFEAFKREHLTKITPVEAHASLIAKIDAHFNPEGGAESRE